MAAKSDRQETYLLFFFRLSLLLAFLLFVVYM